MTYRSKYAAPKSATIRVTTTIALLLPFACLLYSCGNQSKNSRDITPFAEGRIEYDIAWKGGQIDPMFAQMFPSQLTLLFRDPILRFDSRGAGGIAQFSWFVNTNNGDTNLFITVAGVKMHYSESVPRNSIIELVSNKRLPRTATKYFDTIYMGYPSIGITAALETGDTDKCRIVCAPTIGWVGMNAFSIPFDGLEGCMVEGEFELIGHSMHAKAKRIISMPLHDTLFQMPTGHRPIEINALRQLLGLQPID